MVYMAKELISSPQPIRITLLLAMLTQTQTATLTPELPNPVTLMADLPPTVV